MTVTLRIWELDIWLMHWCMDTALKAAMAPCALHLSKLQCTVGNWRNFSYAMHSCAHVTWNWALLQLQNFVSACQTQGHWDWQKAVCWYMTHQRKCTERSNATYLSRADITAAITLMNTCFESKHEPLICLDTHRGQSCTDTLQKHQHWAQREQNHGVLVVYKWYGNSSTLMASPVMT